MKITGIIAEYNPFHNGHAYQLKCAREETGADYIVVAMSGNFVQRGSPALLDKYARAKMALLGGADLVIELPVLWSTASAEYFAGAGVALFNSLGCVDALSYGCETVDAGLFAEVCRRAANETPQYQAELSALLRQGFHYAKAREQALLGQFPAASHAAVRQILENPNNILALEYQKAIACSRSVMDVYPVLRIGQGYHSKKQRDTFASASAIRRTLQLEDGLLPTGRAVHHLASSMPQYAFQVLADYARQFPFLDENDCSQMLHYCLLLGAQSGYGRFADCTPDFSNKIRRRLDRYTNFTEFCACLKSKDMTHARIRRILLHILLNICQSDYEFWKGSFLPYIRILGFRQESRGLLTHIKKHVRLPLLARAADAKKILAQKQALSFFQKTLFADDLYRSMVTAKSGCVVDNEYRRKLVIL